MASTIRRRAARKIRRSAQICAHRSRNCAQPRMPNCAVSPMFCTGRAGDAGYHEPTRGDAAADLERFGRERVAADRNGDVAAGRRRGFDAAVGNPARADDRRAGAAESHGERDRRRPRRGAPGRAGRGRQFRRRLRPRLATRWRVRWHCSAPRWPRSGCASACTPARSSCATRPTTPARPSTAPRGCAIWPTAGRRCCRGSTESLVVDRLPDGVWLTELGSYPLRGVPRPERVVQLCHPDLRNEFPPLRVAQSLSRRTTFRPS